MPDILVGHIRSVFFFSNVNRKRFWPYSRHQLSRKTIKLAEFWIGKPSFSILESYNKTGQKGPAQRDATLEMLNTILLKTAGFQALGNLVHTEETPRRLQLTQVLALMVSPRYHLARLRNSQKLSSA